MNPLTDPPYAYPIRPWSFVKVDSGFLDLAYLERYEKWHRGVDLNGIKGGATDLGYPVQAMFPGKVIGVHTTSRYGNAVLVKALPEVAQRILGAVGESGTTLEVFYAHLHQITVNEGDAVIPGDHIGSIGGTGGSYTPHLHLEIRRTPGPMIVTQGGSKRDYEHALDACLDPMRVFHTDLFSDYGPDRIAALYPQPTPAPEPEPDPTATEPDHDVLLAWGRFRVVLMRK